MSITVTPVAPKLGAEIGNIDLTKPLSDQTVTELKRAFTEHQVIFFRDQKLSVDDLARAAGYFGTPENFNPLITEGTSQKTEHPVVRRLHYDDKSPKVAGENWHSDQTCVPMPPLGTMLYHHTIPPNGGGDTMFGSMYEAYEALSPKMKSYLEGLTATHDGKHIFGPTCPSSVHPVVVRHPESGRKLIFVNTTFTRKMNELPAKEGNALLRFLLDHCAGAEWTCRFRWSPHSMVFWDNRCTHHRVIGDFWPHVRSGYRVQVEGSIAPAAG
jgi:alpha-ketoglutarate-dependent taurine dioxygenase